MTDHASRTRMSDEDRTSLEGSAALIWGGGGAIGGSVAAALFRRGADVTIAGRTEEQLRRTSERIASGKIRHVVADALDADQVEEVTGEIARTQNLKVVANMIGVPHAQGKPLDDLTLAEYLEPMVGNFHSQFLTGTAAARHFSAGGVILTISTTAAVNCAPAAGGLAAASAAVETLTRQMAIAFGARGIRCICLRPNGMPEAVRTGSHSRIVFTEAAQRHGMDLEDMLASFPQGTILQRSPTLEDVGEAAAYFASPAASSFTGTVEKLGPSDTTLLI